MAVIKFSFLFGILLIWDATLPAGQPGPERRPPLSYHPVVIDEKIENNAHKPKVMAIFSRDGYPDLGSLDGEGFKLYRYTRGWKAYVIFRPGAPAGFEDAQAADINGDRWQDIILGGWSNKTLWAENPAGGGKDPYLTAWPLHVIDSTRFSHEVVIGDLDGDGKEDVVTTSGLYFQEKDSGGWQFKDIGRSGQGTLIARILGKDRYPDVIALYQHQGKNEIAWFENPAHEGKNPRTAKWSPHIIDSNPGGHSRNFEMTTLAFAAGDLNGDGRTDLVCASQGEGPWQGNDPRQVGDGLVWYEAPRNPLTGTWAKHIIDSSLGWVHASSIQLADFNGDGYLDINYAQQDQSRERADRSPEKQELGIFYNIEGKGRDWQKQVISRYPGSWPGGFNSKVGKIGRDRLPSIFTSLHGFFKDANPLVLWQPEENPTRRAAR